MLAAWWPLVVVLFARPVVRFDFAVLLFETIERLEVFEYLDRFLRKLVVAALTYERLALEAPSSPLSTGAEDFLDLLLFTSFIVD